MRTMETIQRWMADHTDFSLLEDGDFSYVLEDRKDSE